MGSTVPAAVRSALLDDQPARTRCDASLRTREEREKGPSHTSLVPGWFPGRGALNPGGRNGAKVAICRLLDAGRAAGAVVRGVLQSVVERGELHAERELDQTVGEPHVLGQERAVQVGADDVAAVHALEAVVAVVALSPQHPSERLLACARLRSPPVCVE